MERKDSAPTSNNTCRENFLVLPTDAIQTVPLDGDCCTLMLSRP